MIAEAIRGALPEVTSLLAGEAVDDDALVYGEPIVLDFLEHGEAGAALEHLVYMVRRPGLPISASTYELIARAGTAMELDPRLWEGIRR